MRPSGRRASASRGQAAMEGAPACPTRPAPAPSRRSRRPSTRMAGSWTVTEAAHLLGISRASAYEAAHRGELPVRVIGRRMLVPRVALLRLLSERS
jgi:excisionase family DNA binding protein